MLKFIISNVKMLLLILGLNKREAKDIFLRALKEMDPKKDDNMLYMCIAIEKVIEDKFGRLILPMDSDIVLKRYGYTRYNYHTFIKKNFPELRGYLINKDSHPAWIRLMDIRRMEPSDYQSILESKELFLSYLSERL